mmetsp:Transcript_9405/g.15101  ORF Transcript_9405/g.15101 Transcript_9405/m.15101 type:complete len:435 (+) Transcript_9405:94-1398(+)
MTLPVSEIILEYVCPAAGMIIANMMFYAPFQDLQKAVRQGHIGDLNPTPWAVMLGNCFGWSLYGVLRVNFWVFFANCPGLLLSVWLNLGAVKLLYQRHHSQHMRASFVQYLERQQQEQSRHLLLNSNNNNRSTVRFSEDPQQHALEKEEPSAIQSANAHTTATSNAIAAAQDFAKVVWDVTSQSTPAPTPHERLVMVFVVLWTCVASFVGFASSTQKWLDESTDIPTQVVGIVVNFNLVFFYGAPLSTIWTVLRQRNTATIHIPTMVTNTLNGSFWLAYGLAVKDPFIIVPNGMGTVLGGIQIVLLMLFPRTPSHCHKDATAKTDLDTPELVAGTSVGAPILEMAGSPNETMIATDNRDLEAAIMNCAGEPHANHETINLELLTADTDGSNDEKGNADTGDVVVIEDSVEDGAQVEHGVIIPQDNQEQPCKKNR